MVLMDICVSTTIVSLLFVLRPSCRRDVDSISEMLVQVPREALEIAGTSINFRSGKFGYSICPFCSNGHPEIFREFWHDFAKKKGHMGYCD